MLLYAREEYQRQADAHGVLVTRSMTLLGFVAALIGLAALMSVSGFQRWILVAGVISLASAAVCGLAVAWLHDYTSTPKSSILKEWRRSPPEETRRQVLFATLAAIDNNRPRLRRVQNLYLVMVALIVLGSALVSVAAITGAIRDDQKGGAHAGRHAQRP